MKGVDVSPGEIGFNDFRCSVENSGSCVESLSPGTRDPHVDTFPARWLYLRFRPAIPWLPDRRARGDPGGCAGPDVEVGLERKLFWSGLVC